MKVLDYETVTLEDVCEKITDGTHQTPTYADEGVTFLSSKNIKSGRIDWENVKYVPRSLHEEYQKRIQPQLNDLLLAKNGTTGVAALVDRDDIEFNIYVSLAILRPTKVIDPRYLYYVVNSPIASRQFKRSLKGVGVPNLHLKEIRTTKIPLPPLSEQKRIADILDKADAIRRKRQQACKMVLQLKEAGFLDLFGDPRTTKKDFPTITLGEVSQIDAPMVDPRENEFSDMIHLGPDRIEKETGRLLPALTAREENLISKKFLFDERYLLYSKIRPKLRKAALPNFSGLCSADMYPVRPVEGKTTREFLYSLLISEAFLDYTESLSSRANIPKINRKEFAAYEFPLPPYELQVEYANFMRAQETFSRKYSHLLKESNDLFNSLVQRAFKGRL